MKLLAIFERANQHANSGRNGLHWPSFAVEMPDVQNDMMATVRRPLEPPSLDVAEKVASLVRHNNLRMRRIFLHAESVELDEPRSVLCVRHGSTIRP